MTRSWCGGPGPSTAPGALALRILGGAAAVAGASAAAGENALEAVQDAADEVVVGSRLLLGDDARLRERTDRQAEEALLSKAHEFAPAVVMKAGARGAYIAASGGRELVPGVKVEARDTTGAGDSFAAGYLSGLLAGKDPRSCAALGNRLASSIVTVEGCAYGKIDAAQFGMDGIERSDARR